MVHFGKWIYDPKTKTLTHSESDGGVRQVAHIHFRDPVKSGSF